ncbi:MAG: hypothetical protein ACKVTZ_08530 [Bacteroidia bacterium]
MNFYLITLLSALSLCCYSWIGITPRTDFTTYLAFMLLSFGLYHALFVRLKEEQIILGIIAGFIFRICFLFFLPQLSDDYFRFLWDGKLVANGINPFLYLPSELKIGHENIGLTQALFERLNSPQYYSVYPPVCQAVFGLAAALFPNNLLAEIVCMKAFILLAEAGSLFFLYKLLQQNHFPLKNVLHYALNPLAIVELTGNLHFEAFMIVGILGALYFLQSQQPYKGGLFFAIAVCSKLLPLMILPFFIRKMGMKQGILWTGFVLLLCLLAFAPFYHAQMLPHFLQSTRLYFQSFEFNASIYYLAREIGYWIWGYNIIGIVGKIFPILVIWGILRKAFFSPPSSPLIYSQIEDLSLRASEQEKTERSEVFSSERSEAILQRVKTVGLRLVGLLPLQGRRQRSLLKSLAFFRNDNDSFFISKNEKNNPTQMGELGGKILFAFCLYFLFATTVNPWYIVPLLAFSTLTPYRFLTLWTILLPFTYYAYAHTPYHESLGIVVVEYVLVMGYAGYELMRVEY